MNNYLAAIPIHSVFDVRWGYDKGFADFVSVVLFTAISIASVILLALLIFGGISIIIGAGSSNPESTAKGKKAVTSAIIGFLIIFTAYWIIQIVAIIAGFPILNPST